MFYKAIDCKRYLESASKSLRSRSAIGHAEAALRRDICACGHDQRRHRHQPRRAQEIGGQRRAGRGRRTAVQDAVALAFVRLHGAHYRFVPAWRRWIGWDGKRWGSTTGRGVLR